MIYKKLKLEYCHHHDEFEFNNLDLVEICRNGLQKAFDVKATKLSFVIWFVLHNKPGPNRLECRIHEFEEDFDSWMLSIYKGKKIINEHKVKLEWFDSINIVPEEDTYFWVELKT